MTFLWNLCVTLFTLGAAFMVLFLRRHQESIKIWRIRRAHRLEREAYIRQHGQELMEAMSEHQLMVLVDPELDEAHDNAALRYEQEGYTYLLHLERTDEQVQIQGHPFLFNNEFAQRLIRQYCLPRWWLLSQYCCKEKEGWHIAQREIFLYLHYLLQPRIDRETRPRQRAMIRERDAALQ